MEIGRDEVGVLGLSGSLAGFGRCPPATRECLGWSVTRCVLAVDSLGLT